MHNKKFLTVLVLFSIVSLSPHAILGQSETPTKKFSIRQEIDMNFENLKRNLKAQKEIKLRADLVNKYIKATEDLRKNSARQLEADEIYFDLLQAGLEELPLEQALKPKECKAHEQKVRFEFHPNSKEPETEPTRKTLEILKILCKTK